MALRDQLDRLRQPEHTGRNRCKPCTALNVLLAAVLAVATGLLFGSDTVSSAILTLTLFLFSIATIAVRGYLVPGTPWLTKTYLPDRIRNRLHTRPSVIEDEATATLALQGVGAIEPTADRHPETSTDGRDTHSDTGTDGDELVETDRSARRDADDRQNG